MPKLPGINHLNAVKAFEKAGFRIIRQGKHVVMSEGIHFITIPRHNPVNAITMAGIVRDAGLTIEQFKKLLEEDTGLTGACGRPPRKRAAADASSATDAILRSLDSCREIPSGN